VEHVDELIPGYALHALDADDERIVVAHMSECERCRARLRDYEGVAAALAHTAPPVQPPPQLRERLLEAIEPVVAAPAAAAPPAPAASRRSWWTRISAVAVPALAAVVVVLAIWNISLRNDLDNKDVRAVAPIGKVGSVVSYAGGHVALLGHLAPAPAGHVYEAWVIPDHGKGTPIAAGTFTGGPVHLTLTHSAGPGDVIAVTLEKGQGGTAPKGTPVGGSAPLA
jgi:anti-sigma-K factor RskA